MTCGTKIWHCEPNLYFHKWKHLCVWNKFYVIHIFHFSNYSSIQSHFDHIYHRLITAQIFRLQQPWGRSQKYLRTCCIELKDIERVCPTRHARNSIGPLPEDYCERKNPKSSVLSVLLLIYDIYLQHYPYKLNYMFKTLKSTSIKTCFLPVVRIHA